MTVLTGRNSQVVFNDNLVLQAGSWSLERTREMRRARKLCNWDDEYVPDRQSGSGTINLLYNKNDTAAVEMMNSILLDDPGDGDSFTLLLDKDNGLQETVLGFVSEVSTTVSVGSASAITVSFVETAPEVFAVISGLPTALRGSQQIYSVIIFGLSGPWAYFWECLTVGAVTFDDNTSATPVVTFNSVGTVTLRVTATLGSEVVTDDITVTVNDVAAMWFLAQTNLRTLSGNSESQRMRQSPNGGVWLTSRWRDNLNANINYFTFSYADSTGDVKFSKRIDYQSDPLDGEEFRICALSDGSAVVYCRDDTSSSRVLKISSAGSVIWYRQLSGGFPWYRTVTQHPATGNIILKLSLIHI